MLKEIKDRVRSFGYAWEGIVYLVKSQHNAWIHLIVTVLAIVVGFWLGISRSDWALLVLAMMGVWMGEAVNTAVEAIVDMVQPDFHPMAKIAKDVAAGGVLLSAVAAAIVGLLVLGPPLVEMIGTWLVA
ncbi:MAG: diacylglycerol kinase family protein [Anaerolineae bacterium]